MGVIGTSAGGYATVLPTQGNPMGDAMANVENSMFRFKAQKIADERTKLEAENDLYERRRQEFSDAQQFSKDNPFVATGMGIDGANMQGYMNFKNTANAAQTEFLKTGDPKQQAIYMNAVAGAKAIGEMPTQLNNLVKSWDEHPELFNAEDLKNKRNLVAKLGAGGAVPRADENGRPVWDLVEKDDNGNIVKIVEKGVNAARMKKLLDVVPAFNIDDKDGLIERFSKNVGKEVKVTEGTGLNAKERTYTPGAKEFAKIVADNAIKDRSGMYETLLRMKLDPNDENNYTDEKVRKDASQYLQNILMTTRQEAISEKPDTSIASLEESKRQHKETTAIARENLKVSQANSASTISAREVDKNTDKISKTSVVLTKSGKERLAKYKKANPDIKNIDYNLVGFAPGEYETVTTSTAVVKKAKPVVAKKEIVQVKQKVDEYGVPIK